MMSEVAVMAVAMLDAPSLLPRMAEDTDISQKPAPSPSLVPPEPELVKSMDDNAKMSEAGRSDQNIRDIEERFLPPVFFRNTILTIMTAKGTAKTTRRPTRGKSHRYSGEPRSILVALVLAIGRRSEADMIANPAISLTLSLFISKTRSP